MRLSLALATLVAVASVAYIVVASLVIQRQLDAAGVPNCLDPNVCYPQGAAMDAVFRMELNAAFAPPLIGLLLVVALAKRWSNASLGVALVAGMVLTGAVALTHRLVGARYTVLANDTYELLQMLHLNHPGFMVTLTLVITALGGVFALRTGRVLPTLALSVAGWPVALIVAYLGVGVLALPIAALAAVTGAGDSSQAVPGDFSSDIGFADGFGYAASVVLILFCAGLVRSARRRNARRTA